MSLSITLPEISVVKPKISVFGVGGAGGNALNNMISSDLEGVEFIAANTDSQSLENSLASNRIRLGLNTTKGLGAGSVPDRGREAAEENIDEINKYLEGNNMVFITAGMGGGTGTGAAPVIAKLAKEKDILTVGVVTKPFDFEGKYRMESALRGIEELKKYVDTLIIIPNQNLFRVANENTTFESAFKMADNVLHAGVRGVTDLITMPGLVNLDFADIKTIMTKMGKAMMGTGEASGDNRAIMACQEAISNPLLDDVSIKGAKGVLVNMTGGPDMTLFEADQAVNEVRRQVDENANIIFGSAFNKNMEGKIRVSVVATGIDSDENEADFINHKTIEENNKMPAFFDPYDVKKIGEKVVKIGSKDFKPKVELETSVEEELISVGSRESQEVLNLDLNSEGKKHEKQSNFDNAVSSDLDFDKAFKQEDVEDDDDSNNSGFSLFGFLSGGSNKKSRKKRVDKENNDKKSPLEESILDFSFNENTIKKTSPDEDKINYDIGQDDDILNIPAFFRKKNNNL